MYEWKNKWISTPEFVKLKPLNMLYKEENRVFPDLPDELKNHHTLYRKKINIEKLPSNAKLYISADDYYKLYINGRYVTEGPANAYHFCYNYNIIDVTDFLLEGENTLFVHVFYQGLVNRATNSGDLRQGMIVDLLLDDNQVLDNEWKYSYAKEFIGKKPIPFNTQFYDIIDNRLAFKNCEKGEFDATLWEIAPINADDDHILTEQITPNVVSEKVFPFRVTEVEKGYIYDFETEKVGTFSAVFTGKKIRKWTRELQKILTMYNKIILHHFYGYITKMINS